MVALESFIVVHSTAYFDASQPQVPDDLRTRALPWPTTSCRCANCRWQR